MENKSIGGALVDVFDAGVSLVKTEINLVARRVGNVAKAKGLGVVLLLAALVPLTLALVFLILFVFYGLERLGLAAWSAALIMGLVSLIVTAALIFVGLKRLGADVPDDAPKPAPLSDVEKDDLKYGGKPGGPGGVSQGAGSASAIRSPFSSSAPATTGSPVNGSSATGNSITGNSIKGNSIKGNSAAPYRTASGLETGTEVGHTTGGHQAVMFSPVNADSVNTAGQTASRVSQTKGTSTEGKPSNESDQKGVEVSTHPTYRDDMKKEGY